MRGGNHSEKRVFSISNSKRYYFNLVIYFVKQRKVKQIYIRQRYVIITFLRVRTHNVGNIKHRLQVGEFVARKMRGKEDSTLINSPPPRNTSSTRTRGFSICVLRVHREPTPRSLVCFFFLLFSLPLWFVSYHRAVEMQSR